MTKSTEAMQKRIKELKELGLYTRGFKKGQISWNKGKKGVQIAWNKGLKGLNVGTIKRRKR